MFMVVTVTMPMIVAVIWRVSDYCPKRLESNIPCRKIALMMLSPRPTAPMIKTSLGCSTSAQVLSLLQRPERGAHGSIRCSEMKRSIACRKMLNPSAARKTPLKNAPRSCARCQPNEKPFGECPWRDIYASLVVELQLTKGSVAREHRVCRATSVLMQLELPRSFCASLSPR